MKKECLDLELVFLGAKAMGKSVDHPLLHCPIAIEL